MKSTILWFRQDLRLDDNPALLAAMDRRGPVVPVYIWAPEEEGQWSPGSASRWWLHYSLDSLDKHLRRIKSRLVIRAGDSIAILQKIVQQTGSDAVCWNRRYEPAALERDAEVNTALHKMGVGVSTFNSGLLYEPGDISTGQGGPFRVFTPFWKACRSKGRPPLPRPAPRHLPAPSRWPASLTVDQLQLLPKPNWAKEIAGTWVPGEHAAIAEMERFIQADLLSYQIRRDQPWTIGTSRLSPYLHRGEISPRRIWFAIKDHPANESDSKISGNADAYLRQLGWREFAYHLLYHFPHTVNQPLRSEFARFPWRKDARSLKAWREGRTGYPMVDAGMRELWRIGWMHNRVRMVVASFLVKHLLIPWQEGARWFWDTLVDADLANNTLGWQWTAGCGADAAPYFRIFNPHRQADRFDPDGQYVRQWIPECDGRDRLRPLVNHTQARQRALAAYAEMRKRTRNRSSQ